MDLAFPEDAIDAWAVVPFLPEPLFSFITRQFEINHTIFVALAQIRIQGFFEAIPATSLR